MADVIVIAVPMELDRCGIVEGKALISIPAKALPPVPVAHASWQIDQ